MSLLSNIYTFDSLMRLAHLNIDGELEQDLMRSSCQRLQPALYQLPLTGHVIGLGSGDWKGTSLSIGRV